MKKVVKKKKKKKTMGRSPCCDKEGVKKGAWTPEEDKILVDYINKNGHGTWRSLPKLAGIISLFPHSHLLLFYFPHSSS